ncbi:MAG TPA: transposase, partial [Mycobacteriales bacterium]
MSIRTKDTHVAAVLTALGALVGTRSFPATAAGYRQLLGWARSFGVLRRVGVEGTGCYGAGLSRYLRAEQVQVLEVNRPDRATRRRRGKTDPVDAEAAARAVLAGRAGLTPKTSDGPVEVLRVFKLARDSAVKART